MVINAKGSDLMFPVINKRATGINLRKIMDEIDSVSDSEFIQNAIDKPE